ncbi:hypothetical protein SEVIR_5G351450v4 [Setaria viridis]
MSPRAACRNGEGCPAAVTLGAAAAFGLSKWTLPPCRYLLKRTEGVRSWPAAAAARHRAQPHHCEPPEMPSQRIRCSSADALKRPPVGVTTSTWSALRSR